METRNSPKQGKTSIQCAYVRKGPSDVVYSMFLDNL